MTKDMVPEGWETSSFDVALKGKDGVESEPKITAHIRVAYPTGRSTAIDARFLDLTHVYRLLIGVAGARFTASATCRDERFGDIGEICEQGSIATLDVPVETGGGVHRVRASLGRPLAH